MPIFSTACPRNCYSSCSFQVVVEDNKIINIISLPLNRATPNGVCLKGLSYIERSISQDRIISPLRKNKLGDFETISWDEALLTIAEKLIFYKNNFGSHSVLFYSGSGMNGLLNNIANNFWKLYGGVTKVYGSLCWSAGLEAVRLTLGENKHNIPWDLKNAKLIILWGKNPAETNIHQTVFINEAAQNGAKLIVIDPRRTASAERADYLFVIKPGTDAALALGIANILITRNWIDRNFIDNHVLGFEEFAKNVRYYTPEIVENITDIPQKYILQLAEYIATVKPMTIIPGYGMQRFTNGGQTIRAILSLNILTGNIGKPGACFHYADLQSAVFHDLKEPLSYYPSQKMDYPFRRTIATARLGMDILNMKNPEIKMLWCERGNPVTQNPDTRNILKAIRNVDFKVVVEQFMTDTAKEADIVLPAKNMFEQADIVNSYWNPYIQLKKKILQPPPHVKPETEIYWNLAKLLNFNEEDIKTNLIPPQDEEVTQYLKLQIEKFTDIKWEDLEKAPQILKSHQEIAFADNIFATPSGKIELLSEQAKEVWNIDKLPEYVQLKETDNTSEFKFYLLTPNTKNKIHSQFGNLKMIKNFEPEPYVTINIKDAAELGINNEDMVKVYNSRGEINLKAHITFAIKSRCLSIANGWWINENGSLNSLSAARETDIGHGTAFHDNMVNIKLL